MTTENKRIIGKITKVDEKGWGFITSKDMPFTRIFFHWTALLPTTVHFTELKTGMKVEFECIDYQDRGYRAIRINVMETEHEPSTEIQG